MEWLIIYLFVMIEKIGAFFALGWPAMWLGLGGFLVLLFFSAMYCAETSASFEKHWASPMVKNCRTILKSITIVGLIFGSFSYWIPDQKSMAIIAGTGITYKAVTSETGQRLGGKAISLLEQRMDEALNDVPDPKSPKEAVAK